MTGAAAYQNFHEKIDEKPNDSGQEAEARRTRFTGAVLTPAMLDAVAILFLRLSEDGLVNLKTGKVAGFIFG